MRLKVLQVCAVDVTVKYLLLPLIDRLETEHYEVHIACSPGLYLEELTRSIYHTHPIAIARSVSPISNLKSLWHLYRLMCREKFQIVHVHTPVAAVLGRIAAKMARVPVVIYTAHGFYFHENMHPWSRRLIIWVEKVLGRYFTDWVFTQSREDYETALREKIVRDQRITWIGNGTNPEKFLSARVSPGLRQALMLSENDRVVGFIGRLVREKGIEELILAMRMVVQEIPNAKLLVVGDTLDTDRDRRAKERIRHLLDENGLTDAIVFAGHREDIPELLSLMEIFVLPSYREGMPRSIIEAMFAGKPVVATNIRGSREEVVNESTGFLVPLGNVGALAEAILKLLRDPERARKMGEAGGQWAISQFDERFVLERELGVYKRLIVDKIQRESRSG